MDTQPKHIMSLVTELSLMHKQKKNVHQNIPGSKVTSPNFFFCQTISTKPKEEKQQILTFTKMKLANV